MPGASRSARAPCRLGPFRPDICQPASCRPEAADSPVVGAGCRRRQPQSPPRQALHPPQSQLLSRYFSTGLGTRQCPAQRSPQARREHERRNINVGIRLQCGGWIGFEGYVWSAADMTQLAPCARYVPASFAPTRLADRHAPRPACSRKDVSRASNACSRTSHRDRRNRPRDYRNHSCSKIDAEDNRHRRRS